MQREKKHYTQFPEKKKIALEKRRITRLKYKKEIFEANRKRKINYDKKLKEKIKNSEPYTLEYTISVLSDEKYLFYLGKSKNYTMIKQDIRLYKSVMYYTEKYIEEYCGKYLPFSCRVQLLGRFKLNVPREYYCKCGIKLKFDKTTQDFTFRGFCNECGLTPTEEEFYKYKFPDNWEEKFNEHKNKMKLCSRNIYATRVKNGKSCNKGRNEEYILDYIEKINNIKIIRDFVVCGYYPDGYCKETNTIYEVYEPFHLKKQFMEKDLIRQKNIMKELNCNFVIIYDSNPKIKPIVEKLKIEKYE